VKLLPETGVARYFALGAVVGIIVVSRLQMFRYPIDVYQEQGWPTHHCGQLHLRTAIRVLSFLCFLNSFSSTEFALCVAAIAWRWDLIRYWWFRIHLAENVTPFRANGGRLLSEGQYEEETRRTTERELEKLRDYINQNPSCMHTLASDSVANVELFRYGRDHMPPQWDDEPEEPRFRNTQNIITVVVVGVCIFIAYSSFVA